jgi:predicted MPP superfamily phosphohydrolase
LIFQNQKRIKIIQISDLHFDELRYSTKNYCKKINSIQLDLVFITGDSVDKTGKNRIAERILQLINQSIQKYAITGNWEY